MRLNIHTAGEQFTVTITGTGLGKEHTASLSGLIRWPLIDGLLWWLLDRKLDTLVAYCLPLPIHASMPHAQALSVAEGLTTYVHTAPYYRQDVPGALKTLRTIRNKLPELKPLAEVGQEVTIELQRINDLLTILMERTVNESEGRALHAVEHFTTFTQTQAA